MHELWHTAFLLLLILMFGSGGAEIEDGVSYIVGAGKMDCFYRDLKSGDKMDVDFQVMSGGDADISFYIRTPSGDYLMNEHRKSEVTADFNLLENGTYEICFDNSFSTFTDKVVYFDLGIQEDEIPIEKQFADLNLVKDNLEKPEYNSFMSHVENVASMLETVMAMQGVTRARMARHHFLQESNLSLVSWFSGLSCLAMIAVGSMQVILIRNLFKERLTKC